MTRTDCIRLAAWTRRGATFRKNAADDAADRVLTAGSVAYTHDANGNATARGSDTFTWDAENRLLGATIGGTTSSHTYRGDGLRDASTTGGVTNTVTWDLNRGLPVVLQDSTRTYVYGLGGQLISQVETATNTPSYLLQDGLGSTVALTDAAGTVTATYAYDAFGSVRATTGTASTAYGYTGQQTDGSGLQYLRARYYDPSLGRFLSQDPLVQGAPPSRSSASSPSAKNDEKTLLVSPSIGRPPRCR